MISHKHKTIFVHVPKCGGQSVETAFLNDEGLTWKERAPLLLKRNDDPKLGPTRLAHLYASEYVSCGHISQETFSDYFKFAVVRHPMDRILSSMNYRGIRRKTEGSNKGFGSVEEYLSKLMTKEDFGDARRHASPQAKYLTDPKTGDSVMDKIVKLENLSEEFLALSQDIFGTPVELPWINSSDKKEWTKDTISASDIEYIKDLYKEDYELLGY